MTQVKCPPPPDLNGPFRAESLLELRSGKMTPMPSLAITSGINKIQVAKDIRHRVTVIGLSDDEHDLTFHGGPDKALHHYCSEHYPLWGKSYPESAHLFVPGGFGENLVTKIANEHNICIGDIIRIGPTLRVQVSLPRQPCYKLNHRFKLKNFACETYKANRTGWYYRVLTEGDIAAGDIVELEARKWPTWTIARIQHYLYVESSVSEENEQVYQELAGIEELGEESRKHFRNRVTEYTNLKNGIEAKEKVKWSDYCVLDIKHETKTVKKIIFEAVRKQAEPEDIICSYIRIKLKEDLMRAYSVIAGNTNTFTLGVALDATSKRGGSRYIHETLKPGGIYSIAAPVESVPFQEQASHHIFIVGGIGVTAFPPMWKLITGINYSIEIHWAVRGSDEMPFKEMVEVYGDRVHIYDSTTPTTRVPIRDILENRKWNSHIYVCAGPNLKNSIQKTAKELGIPEKEIHYEAFQAETGGDPFTVEVKGKEELGKMMVGGEETLLQVLRKAGLEVDSSCEVGNCGTCKVRVCKGAVENRGVEFGEEVEGERGMLSCVSRGRGHIVIEV